MLYSECNTCFNVAQVWDNKSQDYISYEYVIETFIGPTQVPTIKHLLHYKDDISVLMHIDL